MIGWWRGWMVGLAVGIGCGMAEAAPSGSDVWQDPVVGMAMVRIEADCFAMGSREPALGAGPVHRVCLDSYWMGQHEVTNRQYGACVAAGACQPPERHDSGINDHFRTGNEDEYDKLGEALDGPDHPVVGVSLVNGWEFVRWLSARSGQRFRLPTEAEWEYACRAKAGDEPLGNETQWEARGWSQHNSGGRPHAVGSKAPNALGLYDMQGNVWEWVQDHFDVTAYGRHAERNPLFVKEDLFHVSRGGSWSSPGIYLHCAYRGVSEERDRDDNLGLRVVREE
ncbi:MAG: formylglycine-generating enzyme family protein [Magnetococcales bacterium]|nr:formylglycine-generating enzyme family protein [Magnetococcales bacterium]